MYTNSKTTFRKDILCKKKIIISTRNLLKYLFGYFMSETFLLYDYAYVLCSYLAVSCFTLKSQSNLSGTRT